MLDQGSPNISVRGPHKLLHNSPRVEHEIPFKKKTMSNMNVV